MNINSTLASIILDLNITSKYQSYLEIFFENSAPFLYLIPHFKKMYMYSSHVGFVNRFKEIHYKSKDPKKAHVRFICIDYRSIIPYSKKVIFCNPLMCDEEFWTTMRRWRVNNLLIIYAFNAPKDFIRIKKVGKKYIYLHKDHSS